MLLDLLWLSVLAYVVVQVIVLRRASGFGRVAAALPLLVVVPVFVLNVVNLVLEKNLWPARWPCCTSWSSPSSCAQQRSNRLDHTARKQTCDWHSGSLIEMRPFIKVKQP